MPDFWSFIGNEKFDVGCTGRTVYVYDKTGKELAKFKDLNHAYTSYLSPKGDIFAVKTLDSEMAVYSLESLSLIKKFRYSKVDDSQDFNACFSPDGKEFYNVERLTSSSTAISVYDTKDFSFKKQIIKSDANRILFAIEFDGSEAYVLFMQREQNGNKFYISKLIDDELCYVREIPEKKHEYYFWFLILKQNGFTKKAKQFSGLRFLGYDLTDIQNQQHTLSELYDNEPIG